MCHTRHEGEGAQLGQLLGPHCNHLQRNPRHTDTLLQVTHTQILHHCSCLQRTPPPPPESHTYTHTNITSLQTSPKTVSTHTLSCKSHTQILHHRSCLQRQSPPTHSPARHTHKYYITAVVSREPPPPLS